MPAPLKGEPIAAAGRGSLPFRGAGRCGGTGEASPLGEGDREAVERSVLCKYDQYRGETRV